MALEDLEGPDKFLSALVRENPFGTDPKSQGDDHIRGVKNVILNTFGELDEFTALPFTKQFISAEQVITTQGQLVLAHDMGIVPKMVQYELICLVAASNYDIGDIAPVPFSHANSSDGSTFNSCTLDVTNITVRYASRNNCFTLGNKDTGAAADLDNAQWALVVKAWA